MDLNKDTDMQVTSDLEEVENSSGHGEKTLVVQSQKASGGSQPHIHSLERYINLSSIFNFGFILLASWESFAVTFQFALYNGGPAAMFYGSILASIGVVAVGSSLAELASIDPTVGAQYRWTANLAPRGKRFWGLLQGWITVSAWCFACSGPPSILANMITSLAIFNNESYVPERWHTSLIMIATIIVPFVFNLWFRKLLDAFEIIGGVLHIVLFLVMVIVLIVFGPRSSPEFVFKTLTWDQTGWNNAGVSWGLGLLTLTFSVSGFDSVLHMSDEVKKVHTRVPRSIILACVFNSLMMFIFVTVLLFYIGPLDPLYSSPLPLLQVLYGATGSKAATNTLVSLICVIMFFALFNIFASVSRLVWVFARDKGLPFHNFFSYVHPTLKLPVNALLLVGSIVTLLSLIYIASAAAFNALIALQALAIYISYFFPIFFILLRRLRGPPPPYGPFKLGKWGIPANVFGLCYVIFVVIWMPLPQVLPVTKDNMNYAGPIFGVVVALALADWFISGRTRFQMPVTRYE
ncbi:amino acid transporter [Lindgomyces ingoldianus]|uniref:Amino acid transporter n=1 Tax=Lindgomyces ingoldianus TaxID=673940 RepID=A0ACB6R1U9_9PLEO|nr:amino acid transporter [Lindgomyces ingoldianus]KAF2472765.1 amino acid transporter [Lindgomyces ingoldianus]